MILAVVLLMAGTLLTTTAATTMVPAHMQEEIMMMETSKKQKTTHRPEQLTVTTMRSNKLDICRLIVKGKCPNLSYLSIFVVFYPTLFILSNDLLLLGQIMCIVRPQGWPRLNRPIRFYSFRITVESPAAL